MDAEYYERYEEILEAEIRRLEKIIVNATDLVAHLIDFKETIANKKKLAEQGIDPETGVKMIKFPEWKNIQDLG